LIGYLSETPVWRPSYRVVVEPNGKAALQAWGIVQNLSGEDWNDVSLSLVAGAPLAFQSTLGTPVIPNRPIVTDEGEVVAAIPQGLTSLGSAVELEVSAQGEPLASAEATPAEAPAAPGWEGDALNDEEDRSSDKKMAEYAAPSKMKSGPSVPRPVMPPSMAPRRTSELAAVAIEGASTRYDMPFKVTVPNRSATMVLLTSQLVPGENVLLFAPEGQVAESGAHPYRVARIENTTQGLLERGPIAVYERGSFLGQGVLEPLPPRATATVPFALDRSVSLSTSQTTTYQESRLFRIESGEIWTERDLTQRTLYKIDSGNDKSMKLLVKHPRAPGTRLFKPPAGTEDNLGTASALVPIVLRPHGKAELTVEERRPFESLDKWFSETANSAVKQYLADPRADRKLAEALTLAWAIREQIMKTGESTGTLMNEQRELERLSDQTRGNLRAIEKNAQAADLRSKLTRRLAEASSRLEVITQRLIELRMQTDELEVRFTESVRELRLSGPLTAPDQK
jgi:hypothetical protein